MDTSGVSTKLFGRRSVWAVLVLTSLLMAALLQEALCQEQEDSKLAVVREMAQNWTKVGREQYNRAFYKQAEQSFVRAQDYEEYLTDGEQRELAGLLGKTRTAQPQRARILEHVETAKELADRGELIKAKAHLEKVKDSALLTERERWQVVESIKTLDNELEEEKRQIAEVYNRSVELYRAGELEKARDGFVTVARNGLLVAPTGKMAEDYLVQIKDTLSQTIRSSQFVEARVEEPVAEPAVSPAEDELLGFVAEPLQQVRREVGGQGRYEGGYMALVDRRKKIVTGYTKVVLDDAASKVRNYVSDGEFDAAKEVVETAEQTVYDNRLQLGEELFRQYFGKLKQLDEEIVQAKKRNGRQLPEQEGLEAVEAQRRRRMRTVIEREKKIAELADRATAYLKQQRYGEALAQLEDLLAMKKPTNDKSLIRQ